MAGSYSKINYRLRPAKAVERKLICDSLRCLHPFGELASYRYIGFGSTYFSDFILFHKFLHIEDMVSIEKDEHAKERFEYNKPFGCINIKYGDSCEILPALTWNKKSIVWLDYDDPLGIKVLNDIDLLIGKLVSGSILIVTVSAEPERPSEEGLSREEINKHRDSKLHERLPNEKIPINLQPSDLTGKKLAELYKRILDNQLEQSIININSARSAKEKLCYKQVFNFRYADGCRMLTVGWLIFEQHFSDIADQCKFDKNFNVEKSNEAYEIKIPNLTIKEIQHLDGQMPASNCDDLNRICIPLKDVKSYAELYKYFPSFVEMFM
jgi:uncharacterized membrane protein